MFDIMKYCTAYKPWNLKTRIFLNDHHGSSVLSLLRKCPKMLPFPTWVPLGDHQSSAAILQASTLRKFQLRRLQDSNHQWWFQTLTGKHGNFPVAFFAALPGDVHWCIGLTAPRFPKNGHPFWVETCCAAPRCTKGIFQRAHACRCSSFGFVSWLRFLPNIGTYHGSNGLQKAAASHG